MPFNKNSTHNYRDFYKGIPNVGERPLVAQTCYGCGRLLGSKHYQRTRFNTWPRTCKTCCNRRYRLKNSYVDENYHAARRKLQNKSIETASNNNKNWTLRELDVISDGLKNGLKHHEIAPLVNRTLFSVRGAIHNFGLADGWPSRDEWLIKFK